LYFLSVRICYIHRVSEKKTVKIVFVITLSDFNQV